MIGRALALATAATAASAQLVGNVASDGSYSVSLDGKVWFSSPTAPGTSAYALRFDNATHNTANGGVAVSGVSPVGGSDPVLGSYSGWQVSLNNGLALMRVLNYPARNAVVFEQSFPEGLTGTSWPLGSHSLQYDLATAFPAFGAPMQQLDTDLAFLSFAHVMCGPASGAWNKEGVNHVSGSLQDEGGVISFFNSSFATIVMSAANDFLTAEMQFANATGGTWAAGFNGLISAIPRGTTHRTIMVGGQGVNETWYAWGQALLDLGGKARTPAAGNFVDRLSYWTDNGCVAFSGGQAPRLVRARASGSMGVPRGTAVGAAVSYVLACPRRVGRRRRCPFS